jgi:hypothetical protein
MYKYLLAGDYDPPRYVRRLASLLVVSAKETLAKQR